MATKPRNNPVEEQDTREKLLEAAAKVFSKSGYSGSTVKTIAEKAGCNVSLISYHFDGKEGLFRALLEGFGKERLRDSEKILSSPESIEDIRAKLRLWMEQFLLCHVNNDSVCSILHRENVLEEEFLWDIFESTFLKTFQAMVKFFEAAKKKSLIRKDADPSVVASMVFGSLINSGKNQKIQKKVLHTSIADDKYRHHLIDQFLSVLLHGISGSSS